MNTNAEMEVKTKDKSPNLYKDTFSEHEYLLDNFCGNGFSIIPLPEKPRKKRKINTIKNLVTKNL